jgi:GntR family transcriptional regulator
VSADVPAAVPRATLSFVDTLRKDADDTQVRVISVERTRAPPDIAAALELADHEAAVHAVRLRCIEDTVVMLTDVWVPERLGKRITAASLAQRPLYELLMSQGVEFGRVMQEIGAQAADPRQAGRRGSSSIPGSRRRRGRRGRPAWSPIRYQPRNRAHHSLPSPPAPSA